ncbi:MAG: hypothetical protein KKH92_00335 [Firmicutes bacterium]|nr:hypothetical protein [Bacillota bacterium]
MLNEFKEYYDYTRDLTLSVNSAKPRFKSGEIYGRLLLESITKRSGIDRALTIIARRFLFHELNDIEKLTELDDAVLKKRVSDTEKYLLDWCSDQLIAVETPNELIGKYGNGRFYDYMKDAHTAFSNLIKRIESNEIKSTEAHLKDYKSTVSRIEKSILNWSDGYLPGLTKNRFFSMTGMKNKYDNKIVTLDIIIANAINEGPLKHRSVLIPFSTFKRLNEIFESPYRSYMTDFLVTTALYVVNKSENDNDYQMINDAYMSNWLRKKNFHRSFRIFHDVLSQKEHFSQEIVFNVTKKIHISDELTEGILLSNSNTTNEDYLLISDNIPLKDLKKQISTIYTLYIT